MPYATLDQIAHLLKLTPRMVNIHVKHNGMPRVDRGQYDMVKCVHWYLDYKDRLIQEARRGDETEQQARARYIKASANLRELELARARGEVVLVETVRTLWAKILSAFKSRILVIPTKLPQRLIACRDVNQAKEILEAELCEALNELSRADIDVGDLRKLDGAASLQSQPSQSAPKAHDQRVGGQEQSPQPGVKRRARAVANGQG